MSPKSVKSRALFVISRFTALRGSVGFREAFGMGGHQHQTPNAELINKRSHRGWATQKAIRKHEPEIRKMPGPIRNFPILPIRGVPRGSLETFRMGGHQHPTPNAELINIRNRRGRVDQKASRKD